MAKTVLVVDNERHSRELIAHFLREASYDVLEASDGVGAIELLGDGTCDLMICDIVMPQLGAIDVIEYMKSRSISTPVILITGHPDSVVICGFSHLPYFIKPFNMYDLLRKVREMIRT
jgi:DNA-binding response OmpR family regulator